MNNTIIASQIASQLQQAQLRNQIQYAVARKSLDAQKTQGQSAIELVRQAGEISKTAPHQNASGRLDVLA